MTQWWMNLTHQCGIHWMDVQYDSVVDEPHPTSVASTGWMPVMTQLWMNLTLQRTTHWMDGWMPVMSYYNSVVDEIHPPSTGWMPILSHLVDEPQLTYNILVSPW